MREKGSFLTLQKDFGLLPNNHLHYIESIEKDQQTLNIFNYSVTQILAAHEIGLDCEFATNFTKLDDDTGQNSLLQIATDNEVFIFDLISIEKNEAFNNFISEILTGKILKSGVQIAGDLSILTSILG